MSKEFSVPWLTVFEPSPAGDDGRLALEGQVRRDGHADGHDVRLAAHIRLLWRQVKER